jgi:aminotransferase
MGMLFQTIYSCAPPFIQQAGIAALKGDQEVVEKRVNQFRMLRDLFVEKLSEVPGVSCNIPDGAYYLFPNIRATGMTSDEFAHFVLDRAGVVLVPGNCFGAHGEGYVRICYTRRADVIEEACAAMKEALS